jgi:threonine dehydratase
VAVTCGANMNFDRLRFVAERAEFGEQREALFAVTIPEERGSFKRFCELIGPRAVTEFNYRISDEVAHVFVGLAISQARRGRAHRAPLRAPRLCHRQPDRRRLAKEHVRHMVGGRSAGAGRAAVPLRLSRSGRAR